jgi:hypothetical protein
MSAALMWTINDFPAYGMLFGWSTHGKLACPYCMENNKAFTLANRGKAFFFTVTVASCHLITSTERTEKISLLAELKKMLHPRVFLVKNKAHVEASICKAYIVEEISTFISYYFEPHLRMRINRVPRHDDGGEVPSGGNLSIFSNIGRPTPKNVVRGRYLSEIEFKQAHNYVLFNCDELRPFIQ